MDGEFARRTVHLYMLLSHFSEFDMNRRCWWVSSMLVISRRCNEVASSTIRVQGDNLDGGSLRIQTKELGNEA